MEISRTPTATWQDLLAVGGVLLGYAAMNAEDTLFLAIYLSMGAACLILAVRSHKELTTTWRIGLYLFVLVTTAVLGYRTYYKNEQRELDSNAGLLAPAGDALPLSNCLYHLMRSLSTMQGAHSGLIIRAKSSSVINRKIFCQLSAARLGLVSLDASVFDERGNLIVKIA